MRIIGIDPGSMVTGYGIVEQVNLRLCHVASGRVVSPPRMLFHDRLKRIYQELEEVITSYKPEAMAVEDLFVSRNIKSALKLGHARGAAMLAGLNADLAIAEYTPSEVKRRWSDTAEPTRSKYSKWFAPYSVSLNCPSPTQQTL